MRGAAVGESDHVTLVGRLVCIAARWCQPLSCYRYAALYDPNTTTITTHGLGAGSTYDGDVGEEGVDALLLVAPHGAADACKPLVSSTSFGTPHVDENGGQPLVIVGVRFSRGRVHPAELNTLGGLVEVKGTMQNRRLAHNEDGSVPQLLVHSVTSLGLRAYTCGKSRLFLPRPCSDPRHDPEDALHPALASLGWSASRLHYLVDVWCPNVVGHRAVKELLMLCAMAVRLDAAGPSMSAVSSSPPLRVLLQGQKGCGKTILLSAFRGLLDQLHVLDLMRPAHQHQRMSSHHPPQGRHSNALAPDVLLPQLVPSVLSSRQLATTSKTTTTISTPSPAAGATPGGAVDSGRLLSSCVVLIDDWSLAYASNGSNGSATRDILDTLLEDTWALPLIAPSSNGAMANNCIVCNHGSVTGYERGRFVIATNALDAKASLTAAAAADLLMKFHIVAYLGCVPRGESDVTVLSSKAMREISQFSHQTLSSAATRHGSVSSQFSHQRLSQPSSFVVRGTSAQQSSMGVERVGQPAHRSDPFFSTALSAWNPSSQEDHPASYRRASPDTGPSFGGELSAQSDAPVLSPSFTVADILDALVLSSYGADLDSSDACAAEAEERRLLSAWVLHLLSSPEPSSPQNSAPRALVDTLHISGDLPGFVGTVATLAKARHTIDPTLPLVPDCVSDVLRVLALTMEPPLPAQDHNYAGSGGGSSAAETNASARKRLRCIATAAGDKGKKTSKKQSARLFLEMLVQASRSGEYPDGEVPIGICRGLYQKVCGSTQQQQQQVLFDEILHCLSYDAMILKGKHGGLIPTL